MADDHQDAGTIAALAATIVGTVTVGVGNGAANTGLTAATAALTGADFAGAFFVGASGAQAAVGDAAGCRWTAGRCDTSGCGGKAGGAEAAFDLASDAGLTTVESLAEIGRGGIVGVCAGTTSVEESRFQPTGGTTWTMLPHLGQARI